MTACAPEGDQRPHRRLTEAAQADGVGHPACRLALIQRRPQLQWNLPQENIGLLPSRALML